MFLRSFLLVSLVLAVFSGCSQSPPLSAEELAKMPAGEKVFRMNCSSCHALSSGHRALDPLFVSLPAAAAPETFIEFLRTSGPGMMPAFSEERLSGEDAGDLYLWLQSRKGNIPERQAEGSPFKKETKAE